MSLAKLCTDGSSRRAFSSIVFAAALAEMSFRDLASADDDVLFDEERFSALPSKVRLLKLQPASLNQSKISGFVVC